MDKKNLLCITAALFTALLFSCADRPLENAKNFKSNRAPVISSFTSNYSGQLIIPGLRVRVTVEAYDPDNNDFTFAFASEKGSFSNIARNGNLCSVDYIIGEISGGEEITLDVTVSDKKGASSTGSLNIGRSNTGPVLKQLNKINSIIRATDIVPVKFISDSAGYYQVLVIDNDSLSCNYDDSKPWYTLTEETEISISIYGPAYEEGFTPQLNPENRSPDKICIFARDFMGQEGKIEFSVSVDSTPPESSVNPKAGTFSSMLDITVSCADSNECAAISYTLDETDPDFSGNGTVVNGSSFKITIGAEGNGRIPVKYRAVDSAGNIEDVKRSLFIIETESPEITIISNEHNYMSAGGYSSSKLQWQSSLDGTFTILVNGAKISEGRVYAETATDAVIKVSDLTFETNTIEIRVTGDNGKKNSSSFIITKDEDAPALNISHPSNNSYVCGEVLIGADVSDSSGIEKVEFFIDGSLKKTADSAPYSYLWDTNSLSNKHSIMIKAYDLAGNSVTIEDTTVFVDNEKPDIILSSPAKNDTIRGIINLEAEASDSKGVSKVEFYIDGDAVYEDRAFPYEYRWNTGESINGYHTLKVMAYDLAGNTEACEDITVTVDNTPPFVNIINPQNGKFYGGNLTIAASASDNIKIKKVEFYINSIKVSDDFSPPYEYSWTTSLFRDGEYYIKAVVYDYADNSSSDNDTVVSIDNSGPAVNITSPEKDSTLFNSFIISAEADDGSGAGTDRVEFFIDGEKIGEDSLPPFQIIWDSAAKPLGRHNIKAVAYDTLGNSDEDNDTKIKTIFGTKLIGPNEYQSGNDTAVDSEKNIYIAGYTTDEFYTDNGFVMKYNSNGSAQWIYELNSGVNDAANSIAIDSHNNIYVAGYTEGNLHGHTNNGSGDIFISKYNPAGERLWTVLYGSDSWDQADAMAIDSKNNIYIAGKTSGNLDGKINKGEYDVFIAKFNSEGINIWTELTGTARWDEAGDIAVSDNYIYLTGFTDGDLNGEINNGNYDIFIMKLDLNGALMWSKLTGTYEDDRGTGIKTDPYDNIFISGYTAGNLDGEANSGDYDIFLLRYNGEGMRNWTKLIGTYQDDRSTAIAIDNNSLYVTGYTHGNLSAKKNSGISDIFLIKCDVTGSLQWTELLGSGNLESGMGLFSDNRNNIYVTGYSTGNLDNQPNQSNWDIFITRFNSNGEKN